jgi:hypothetical protein
MHLACRTWAIFIGLAIAVVVEAKVKVIAKFCRSTFGAARIYGDIRRDVTASVRDEDSTPVATA